MDKICIILAFNGRWTSDYKYLDHDTKLLLITEGITFEALINRIYQVVNFDRDKFEASIWFEIKLGTSKGMRVTNDEELTTCLHMFKNDSHFKSRFIVDILAKDSESTGTSKTEQVNILNETQQEEGQAIMEIDNQQEMHNQLLEPEPLLVKEMGGTSTTKKTRRRSKYKAKESTATILSDNASSDEITEGSIFEDKKSMIKCFSNIAIKEYFGFKVVRSSTKRYAVRCSEDKCGWFMSAFRINDSTLFKIIKFDNNHECSVDIKKSDQKYAISKLASEYVIDILRETGFDVTPAFVRMEMIRRYGLDIGYHRAWRAIQQGKKNTEENSELALLPSVVSHDGK